MAGPFLPDLQAYTEIFKKILPPQAGNIGPLLNSSLLMALRIMDEQDAVQSVTWYNLPPEISPNLLERIMYYRGNAMFFYMPETNKFYILPYVGEQIDVYGRYRFTTALPFTGTAEAKNKKDPERPWIAGKQWKPQYEIILPSEWEEKDMTDKCVLLSDYSKQMPQKIQPRQVIMEPMLQIMAEIIPFMRTALLNGTGIDGIRINNQDEAPDVRQASRALTSAAIVGDRWIPIVGDLQMETLSHNAQAKCEEFLLALQALDNLRLSLHGLDNGGLFQKKAHMLQDEQNMNSVMASLIMADKVAQRQEFCNIINSIWGLGVWCEASEIVNETDRDGDGEMDSDNGDGATNDMGEGGEENV